MSTTDISAAAESLLFSNSPEAMAEAEEVTQDAPESDDTAEYDEAAQTEAEDEVEDASDDDADESDESTEEDDDNEEPKETLYTVKSDGKEKQVTLDDLKRSYAGQDKIQNGMQQAAQMRKEVEQVYASLHAEQQQFIATVQGLQQSGLQAPPQPPDLSLLDSDPIAYMQADARYKNNMAEYSAQQQQIQAVYSRNMQMQQQAEAMYVQEQFKRLQEMVPEFSDPERAPKIREKLFRTGVEAYGYSSEEMNGVKDARAVQVLMDAMRWRELQAGTAEAKKKPTTPKTVTPNGRRQQPPQLARAKEVAKAKRSGKLEDFASLLLQPKRG